MEFAINVREGYSISPIYLSDDQPLKELALSLGAASVQMVMNSGYLREHQEVTSLNEALQSIKLEHGKCILQQAQVKLYQNKLAEQRDINSRQNTELEDLKSRITAESIAKADKIAKEEVEFARRAMSAKFNAELEEALERERKKLREQFITERTDRDALLKSAANFERYFEELKAEKKESMTCGAVSSSSNLGRNFEELITNYIRQTYGARSGFKLDDVHAKSHAGDLLLNYDGTRIMIELKNYASTTRVPSKEVEKLVRDLAESDPPCHAAVMISANCEITGHYTCGNFEISNTIAKCPILFVNNFLSLGDPMTSLHMIRVFLDMIAYTNKPSAGSIDEDAGDIQKAECIKRCSEFITELDKQTSEIIKQVNLLQTTSTNLKKSVSALIESEIAKFESLKRLLHFDKDGDELNSEVFRPPHALTDETLALARLLSTDFQIDNTGNCAIKDLLSYIMTKTGYSDKRAREMIKAVFLDHHVQHRGYVTGISKKG